MKANQKIIGMIATLMHTTSDTSFLLRRSDAPSHSSQIPGSNLERGV